MRKLFIIGLLLQFHFSFCQHFEFGPDLGASGTNIVNSNITQGRAVIGKALWSPTAGVSLLYYFKSKNNDVSYGIHFKYANSQRGSISEVNSVNQIKFNSDSYNLTWRILANGDEEVGIYADLGLGYNTFNTKNVYHGTIDQLDAFPKLDTTLKMGTNEVTFLYALGINKLFLNNTLVFYAEFSGDAGISTINKESGSYRTQSLGFATGLRYVLINKKPKKNVKPTNSKQ
ncbi:hypothetical protein OX284_002975 [Flavobacterium sp. SUN046]|uniref:hypothetical protein n=1 Tax=Flavobacterium sp. SUN046 TaxID=3002440 RepID=UPI002DBB71F1|nr:hypothetical protein [Flavobacterium sp. SUN046]MEC4048379.1 hypothetical protein [Flavobacterium sp. SUN046]